MRTFVAVPTLMNAADAESNQTSDVLNLNQVFSFSMVMILAGVTVSGTAKLQASVDYAEDMNGNVTNAGTWSDITDSSQTMTDVGQVLWNVSGSNYPYVRAVWTDTASSSATVTVKAFVRGC